jgi:hypothetical protein
MYVAFYMFEISEGNHSRELGHAFFKVSENQPGERGFIIDQSNPERESSLLTIRREREFIIDNPERERVHY